MTDSKCFWLDDHNKLLTDDLRSLDRKLLPNVKDNIFWINQQHQQQTTTLLKRLPWAPCPMGGDLSVYAAQNWETWRPQTCGPHSIHQISLYQRQRGSHAFFPVLARLNRVGQLCCWRPLNVSTLFCGKQITAINIIDANYITCGGVSSLFGLQ